MQPFAPGISARGRGFTILEVVVVVAVVVAFAAVLSPFVYQGKNQLQAAKIASTVDVLRSAVKRYYLDNGVFPFEDSNSNKSKDHNLLVKPAGMNTWNGPYIDTPLTEGPWDQVIVYQGLSDPTYLPGATFSQNGDSLSGTACTVVFIGVEKKIGQLVDQAVDGDTATTGSNWDSKGLVLWKSPTFPGEGLGGDSGGMDEGDGPGGGGPPGPGAGEAAGDTGPDRVGVCLAVRH